MPDTITVYGFLNSPMHLVYLGLHSLKEASLLTDTNKTQTHTVAGAQSDLLNIGEWWLN